jgi:hypothetical protein
MAGQEEPQDQQGVDTTAEAASFIGKDKFLVRHDLRISFADGGRWLRVQEYKLRMIYHKDTSYCKSFMKISGTPDS